MPGPYRAAVGKPHAVRKRPRRGQDPSLRTAPSTSARTPPQVRAATRQRASTHVGGGVPDAPEASRHRPSPGKPPGRACPAPTARRWASPMPSINAHGGVKTPPYEPTHQRVPAPRRKFARPHVNAQPPTYGAASPTPRKPSAAAHPREPPRAGHARPLPRGGGHALCRPQTPAEGSRPLPTNRPPHQRVPAPPTARRCGNGDKKTEAIPFPGTASVLYISI